MRPLDFRYLEDYFEEAEANGQIRPINRDGVLLPGISLIHTRPHTPGGLSIMIDTARGKALITGFCVIDENFHPPKEARAMEMEVIPPGTLINSYEAYDILKKVKQSADILIPLHEPRFAGWKHRLTPLCGHSQGSSRTAA